MKTNWPMKKLGEVAVVDWGNTSVTKKSYTETGYPAFSATGCDGLMETFEQNRDAIILSAIGAQCGKTFYATGKWTAIKNTIIVYSKEADQLLNRYLYYYLDPLKWPISGAGQPFIGIGNAKKIEIPIPLLAIQQKIVERLDAIKKSQELNDLQISKTEELFESISEKIFHNNNFDLNKIEEVVVLITKGTTPTTYGHKFTGEGVPFLRAEDITDNFDYKKAKYHISEETHNIQNRSKTKANDVLITIAGTIGRVAIISDGYPEMNMNQAVCIIRPNVQKVNPYFLKEILQSRFVKDQILGAKVTATLTNLSMGEIKNIKISLPPITEQQKIVEKLSAIQDYKKLLLKQKDLLKELFDSVLHKSMNGEMDV